MHVGIQPPASAVVGDAARQGGSERAGNVRLPRRIAASSVNTSPPTPPRSLPSTSSTITAINTLSSTFSSLAGLVRAAVPAEAAGGGAEGAARPPQGCWTGGCFDRLPERWRSSLIKTILILHTNNSVSIFALPPSTTLKSPSSPPSADMREILSISSAAVSGKGRILTARIVPPATVKGTEWSLLLVQSTTASGAVRRSFKLSLLSLPTLDLIISRDIIGSLAAVKTSSHVVAVSTVHPPALHLLHPRTLSSVLSALVAPAIALDDDRRPIFDVQGRTLVYASAEPAPKGSPAVLRSSAGGRRWEEGVSSLSKLGRSRRSSDALQEDCPLEVDEPASPNSFSRPIPTSKHRRSSSSSLAASKSIVFLALSPPHDAASLRPLLHFSSGGVSTLALSPSSAKLLVSASPGNHLFSVLSLRPARPMTSAKSAVWEAHVLHRGLTPARLQSVTWSDDEQWVGSRTARGTTHFWHLGGREQQALSEGRDVCVRVRQPPPGDGAVEVGFAFAGRPSASEIDVALFDSFNGQHVSLHRLSSPKPAPTLPPPLPAPRLSPSSSSQGSALSLMMSASRKAQALVAASTAGVLDDGHGAGSEWEVFRWIVGEPEDGGEQSLLLLPEVAKTPFTGDRLALALSHAEIETSSPLPRVLPGPIYLSHQFTFSTFDTSTLPTICPLPLSTLETKRAVVRSEVVVSHSPALEAVQSLSSSIDSFNEPLSSAIHSPLTSRPRSLVPSYPNGDGITSSPRSWKSSVGPIVVGARTLGDGLARARQEVGRIASPSGSLQRRSRQSTSKSSGSGGVSFDDDAVSSFSTTEPEEPWEDDAAEAEEGYRALVEEEASFDDLVLGLMDEDGREGDGFQPQSAPRAGSLMGLNSKASALPLTANGLLPPAFVVLQQEEELVRPPSTGTDSSSTAPLREERKAASRVKRKKARGGSEPATSSSGASSSANILRSTGTAGYDEGSK